MHIDRIYRNYLKRALFYCDVNKKNNEKVKKTIAKMAEFPENGVWMEIFLIFSVKNVQFQPRDFVQNARVMYTDMRPEPHSGLS